MSWSKTIKGSFGDVRNALQTISADVHNDDLKAGASESVKSAHRLQARVAVRAAEDITAHAPFQAPHPGSDDAKRLNASSETHEDRELEVVVGGHGNEDGSGNVFVDYKFGPLQPKAKIVS